ncbi:MAG: hypothetical protein IJ130_08275 [Solobacterium sp.]|nr:hypothetical protein [Erysipelotrichaceae bacterium]MBQ9153797.1 hypothetical protein [Solobacterium sp.]
MLEDLFVSMAVLCVLVMITLSAASLQEGSVNLVRNMSEEISESYLEQLERSSECEICVIQEEEDLSLPN